jgi:histidine kinase/DNA gyrase B/HSP90-like ATPase/phospho-acceptor domain-containing protein
MKIFGSANIKIALLLIGIVIIIATLIYTQVIVTEILAREREIANLYAKAIEFIATDESQSGEYNFVFNNIINTKSINFPVIVTDANNENPSNFINVDTASIPQDKRKAALEEMVRDMDEINKPIKVTYRESLVLNYVHFGESALVTKLKILPIIEFIVAGLFVFLGYYGFNYIKRTEQSNIWVGLSRETAHQLGTPLSSLMGWVELLKSSASKPDKVLALANEISNDIDRLTKIANRFSKIGSRPDLKYENIYELIEKIKNYFEKRIPRLAADNLGTVNTKKKVALEIRGSRKAAALINKELFEWVLENLTKNALDAIENSSGKIVYDIQDRGSHINIDVTDSGKGLDFKHKKDIFRPGFSTKIRGWGLGLSLSKRIVETYHSGKLTLKESQIGKGSTFRIRLKQRMSAGSL